MTNDDFNQSLEDKGATLVTFAIPENVLEPAYYMETYGKCIFIELHPRIQVYMEITTQEDGAAPLKVEREGMVSPPIWFMLIQMDIHDVEIIGGVKIAYTMLEKNMEWQKGANGILRFTKSEISFEI
ncbi:hypothetical protein H920_01436 [Fukomys damarensis]|uniref:Uncharacterized protein n=1 Tax=Fukomys damarensis TaxID=885580 RepID=A0A091E1E7_FUKDA|nr:hypothetical protein H920_01436 [Fukomys damarensis]